VVAWLNPDAFVDRTDEYILSILVHEMAHVWQHAHEFRFVLAALVGIAADGRL
jgi:hypothetical protein